MTGISNAKCLSSNAGQVAHAGNGIEILSCYTSGLPIEIKSGLQKPLSIRGIFPDVPNFSPIHRIAKDALDTNNPDNPCADVTAGTHRSGGAYRC
jgi:hypothetical protein